MSSRPVNSALDSDDSDTGITSVAAVPLGRKRRVVDSDSDDNGSGQRAAGREQTEDGDDVHFSVRKNDTASKGGKKSREIESPAKSATAVSRPISFSGAVPIAAAPATRKKKVVRSPCPVGFEVHT